MREGGAGGERGRSVRGSVDDLWPPAQASLG